MAVKKRSLALFADCVWTRERIKNSLQKPQVLICRLLEQGFVYNGGRSGHILKTVMHTREHAVDRKTTPHLHLVTHINHASSPLFLTQHALK